MGQRWRSVDDDRRARELARRGLGVAGTATERGLAAVAHGATILGFFGVGFLLSLVISGIIWLASKKSPYLQEQSDRAGRFQLYVLAVNILGIVLWIVGVALLLYLTNWRGWGGGGWQGWTHLDLRWLFVILDGLAVLVAVPVLLAWNVATIAYGVYAAFRTLGGHDFRYPPPPWRRRSRDPRDAKLRWTD